MRHINLLLGQLAQCYALGFSCWSGVHLRLAIYCCTMPLLALSGVFVRVESHFSDEDSFCLATLFWIVLISRNIHWMISFVTLSYFNCLIVTTSILLMLWCRNTSSLFRSETRRAQLSNPHSRRFMVMARKIKYLLRGSTDVSFQKRFNAPIDEEADKSLLSTS